MKTSPWHLLIAATLSFSTFGLSNPTPRPTPPSPTISPEIQSDRRVTFRFKAPQAKEVFVRSDSFVFHIRTKQSHASTDATFANDLAGDSIGSSRHVSV